MGGGPFKFEPIGDSGTHQLLWGREISVAKMHQYGCLRAHRGTVIDRIVELSNKRFSRFRGRRSRGVREGYKRRQRWERNKLATHAILTHLALRNLSGEFCHGPVQTGAVSSVALRGVVKIALLGVPCVACQNSNSTATASGAALTWPPSSSPRTSEVRVFPGN